MTTLNTQPHFHDSKLQVLGDFEPGDVFYEALMQAHEGLNESQSQLLNARLILVMANHIGELDVLKEAIQMARDHLDE